MASWAVEVFRLRSACDNIANANNIRTRVRQLTKSFHRIQLVEWLRRNKSFRVFGARFIRAHGYETTVLRTHVVSLTISILELF